MKNTFILTNDDGINAEGIQALKQAVKGDKVIVAPQEQLSGCGHQITARKPLTVTETQSQEYAVNGTPADCVRIALNSLCSHGTYVLSGINAGGNLGVDIYISGTVAAVREASILGIPAIAISHVIQSPLKIDWDFAVEWTEKVLDILHTDPFVGGIKMIDYNIKKLDLSYEEFDRIMKSEIKSFKDYPSYYYIIKKLYPFIRIGSKLHLIPEVIIHKYFNFAY